MIESPVERLIKANPDLEIWWDSSPLVYDQWAQKMVAAAEPDRKPVLAEQLRRLYNIEEPTQSIVRGCTTNPPLSLTAIKSNPAFWNEWLDDLIHSNPDLDQKELVWLIYKEVVRRGAEMMLPIWQASKGRFGWLSGQLDPRLFTETATMIQEAEELSALQPNVMIKVPGSMEGIEVLRVLASKGISTNTTVCFTLPQIVASAKATQEGLHLVQKGSRFAAETVDISHWRAVITMMIGRLTESEALTEQAHRQGIELTWQDRHWLGIAIFQRAYRLLKEEGYPSKMLACSMRQGPLVAGKPKFWDVEMLAGDIVYTCPPYVLEPLFEIGDDLDFAENAIEQVKVPDRVLDKLLQIPYCLQAYEPHGMWLEQFNQHPATLETVANFSRAMAGLEEYVGQRIALVRGRDPVMT
jgi:transaldolase